MSDPWQPGLAWSVRYIRAVPAQEHIEITVHAIVSRSIPDSVKYLIWFAAIAGSEGRRWSTRDVQAQER